MVLGAKKADSPIPVAFLSIQSPQIDGLNIYPQRWIDPLLLVYGPPALLGERSYVSLSSCPEILGIGRMLLDYIMLHCLHLGSTMC